MTGIGEKSKLVTGPSQMYWDVEGLLDDAIYYKQKMEALLYYSGHDSYGHYDAKTTGIILDLVKDIDRSLCVMKDRCISIMETKDKE